MAPHEMHRALTDNKAKNARRVAVAATAPTRGSQNVASANPATTLVWFECGNCWTLGDPNFQRDFVNNLQSVAQVFFVLVGRVRNVPIRRRNLPRRVYLPRK
jgi:hypothetical protein